MSATHFTPGNPFVDAIFKLEKFNLSGLSPAHLPTIAKDYLVHMEQEDPLVLGLPECITIAQHTLTMASILEAFETYERIWRARQDAVIPPFSAARSAGDWWRAAQNDTSVNRIVAELMPRWQKAVREFVERTDAPVWLEVEWSQMQWSVEQQERHRDQLVCTFVHGANQALLLLGEYRTDPGSRNHLAACKTIDAAMKEDSRINGEAVRRAIAVLDARR